MNKLSKKAGWIVGAGLSLAGFAGFAGVAQAVPSCNPASTTNMGSGFKCCSHDTSSAASVCGNAFSTGGPNASVTACRMRAMGSQTNNQQGARTHCFFPNGQGPNDTTQVSWTFTGTSTGPACSTAPTDVCFGASTFSVYNVPNGADEVFKDPIF